MLTKTDYDDELEEEEKKKRGEDPEDPATAGFPWCLSMFSLIEEEAQAS